MLTRAKLVTGRQRARAQPLNQLLHALRVGCCACQVKEAQRLERRQHRTQPSQRSKVSHGEALVAPDDHLRLAQLLAAPHSDLEAQCCSLLVISPQLLPQRRQQKRPQLAAGAAEVHGDARLERVAQLEKDDTLLVTTELRERHPGCG